MLSNDKKEGVSNHLFLKKEHCIAELPCEAVIQRFLFVYSQRNRLRFRFQVKYAQKSA